MIALRGATTILKDTEKEVRENSLLLFDAIVKENNLDQNKIISLLITATKDINSSYPGKHIRLERNLDKAAILHFQEMDVKGSLNLCIRFLIYYKEDIDPVNIYLNGAKNLR